SSAGLDVVNLVGNIPKGLRKGFVVLATLSRGCKVFPKKCLHGVGESLTDLESYIAGEAVADDHIHRAAVQIAPLDVTDEVQPGALQQLIRLARQLIAFGLFGADR